MAASGPSRAREPRLSSPRACERYPTFFTIYNPVGHPRATPSRAERGREGEFDRWFQRAERFVVHGQTLAEERTAPVPCAPSRS